MQTSADTEHMDPFVSTYQQKNIVFNAGVLNKSRLVI